MGLEAAKGVTGVTQMYSSAPLVKSREPNWDDYRIFAVVAKERSLGRAAKVLGVAKPTIKRRIESLVTSVGATLVDRNARGCALTKEGMRVADMAEAMAMIADSGVSRFRAPERGVSGECKMVLGEGLATGWFIPHFLGLFSELYPNVVVRLSSAADIDKIAVPTLDMQVRYAPASDDDLLTFRLASFHFTHFASRRYIERHGMPDPQGNLRNHRFADVTPCFGAEAGFFGQYSNNAVLGRPYLFSNSGNILLQSILAGHAIGLLPSYTYAVYPELVAVLPESHYDTGLFVYYSDSASERKPTRAMLDFLRNVVFDKQRMSWFGDHYTAPCEAWREQFAQIKFTAGRILEPSGDIHRR
jgi:DNA-binding transcriptional LysR family regulator